MILKEKNFIENIEIIIDTREKKEKINDHIIKYFDKKGIKYTIRKLEFGDYSFVYSGKSFENEFVIERKNSLEELSSNFAKNRERFNNEFKRARKAKTLLMIEENYKCFEKYQFQVELRELTKIVGFINLAREITRLIKRKIRFGYKDIIEENYNTKLNGKAFYASLLSFRYRYDIFVDFIPVMYSGLHIYHNFYYYLRECFKDEKE